MKTQISNRQKSFGVGLRNQSGQGMTEYIALVMLVAVVCLVSVRTLGSRIKHKIDDAANSIHSKISPNQ